MRAINYYDCIDYIEKKLRIKLASHERSMLKCLCNGEEFISARGIGRSFVAECFGKYIAHLYDRNDYTKAPDAIFPYTVAIGTGMLSGYSVAREQSSMSRQQFEREYLCRWD